MVKAYLIEFRLIPLCTFVLAYVHTSDYTRGYTACLWRHVHATCPSNHVRRSNQALKNYQAANTIRLIDV